MEIIGTTIGLAIIAFVLVSGIYGLYDFFRAGAFRSEYSPLRLWGFIFGIISIIPFTAFIFIWTIIPAFELIGSLL